MSSFSDFSQPGPGSKFPAKITPFTYVEIPSNDRDENGRRFLDYAGPLGLASNLGDGRWTGNVYLDERAEVPTPVNIAVEKGLTRWAEATDQSFAAKWGFQNQNDQTIKGNDMTIPTQPAQPQPTEPENLFPAIGDDWDVEVDNPDYIGDMPIYGGERRGIAEHLIPGRYTGVAMAPQGFEALVHVVVTDDGKSLVSDLNNEQGEAHPDNAGPELYSTHEMLLAENDNAIGQTDTVFDVQPDHMEGLDAFDSKAGHQVTNPMLEADEPNELKKLPPFQPSDATRRAQAWAEDKLAAGEDTASIEPELD